MCLRLPELQIVDRNALRTMSPHRQMAVLAGRNSVQNPCFRLHSGFPVMRWFVFEDQAVEQLYPLALARPAFELICGRESLRRRIQRWFPGTEWGVCLRPWLADVYAEEHPTALVNDFIALQSSRVLMVNGRWMPERRLQIADVSMDNAGFIDGHLAWIALEPEEAQLLSDQDFADTLLGIARTRRVVEASGTMISRPWDLVSQNGRQLELDFADEGVSQPTNSPHVQCLGDARRRLHFRTG